MTAGAEVSDVLKDGAATVLEQAETSIASKLQGDEKDTMLNRLKEAVMKLRKRTDYTDSVSTLSLLLKRYAMVYSRITRDTLEAVDDENSDGGVGACGITAGRGEGVAGWVDA